MDEKMIMSRVLNKDNYNKDDEDHDVAGLLPGFRFHPTDEELVGFYLRRKVDKKPLRIELIKQVDIYKYDPWDLPKFGMVGEKEWYFFCMRGRKYRNSVRPNRVAQSGFWKATGIDKPIFDNKNLDQETSACIGLKKSLVYYIGSAGKGAKTEWMMHEFRLPSTLQNTNQHQHIGYEIKDISLEAEVWTLCRILKRKASFKKHTQPYKKQNTSEQSTNDGSSSTSNFYLEPYYDEICNTKSLIFQQKRGLQNTNHVEEINQHFTMATQPQEILSTGNLTTHELGGGNWDELRMVVEFDPFYSLST